MWMPCTIIFTFLAFQFQLIAGRRARGVASVNLEDEVVLVQLQKAPVLTGRSKDASENHTSSSEISGPSLMNQAMHRRPLNTSVRYKTFSHSSRPASREEHTALLAGISSALESVSPMSHSRHILDFASNLDNAPTLLESGCLYLPTDKVWGAFYAYLGHPYPPLFAEFLGNAFYPGCGNMSMSGLSIERCHNVNVERGHGVVGNLGCFRAEEIDTARVPHVNITVFSTDGFVGLPWKWSQHVQRMDLLSVSTISKQWKSEMRLQEDAETDQCDTTQHTVPEVPSDKKLVLPLKFVICHASEKTLVTPEMIKEQVHWMNEGYSGNQGWQRERFDDSMETPPQVNMQIEFDLVEVEYVRDVDCAMYGLSNTNFVTVYNTRPDEVLVAVIVADDESGVLGMSPLPNLKENQDDPKNMMVVVSTPGLRGFASAFPHLRLDRAYDEGDTLIHESGHALGLYHTFTGGCDTDGDLILDTNPEMFAHYDCQMAESCKSGVPDPVRNFMDYTDDRCLVGFTEMQKRRAWCVLQAFRPGLYNVSIRSTSD